MALALEEPEAAALRAKCRVGASSPAAHGGGESRNRTRELADPTAHPRC